MLEKSPAELASEARAKARAARRSPQERVSRRAATSKAQAEPPPLDKPAMARKRVKASAPPARQAEQQEEANIAKRPARVSNAASSPTLQSAGQFQDAFDHFNRELFRDELEPCMIGFEVLNRPGKPSNAAGCFRPARWCRERGETVIHAIGIDPIVHHARDDKKTLGTLVHEMVHQFVEQSGKGPVKAFHCKMWCEKMVEIGLPPVILDAKGNALPDRDTGKHATHNIEKGGDFEAAYNILAARGVALTYSRIADPVPPKKEKKAKAPSRGRHICPSCEEYAVAKLSIRLQCAGCEEDMIAQIPEGADTP